MEQHLEVGFQNPESWGTLGNAFVGVGWVWKDSDGWKTLPDWYFVARWLEISLVSDSLSQGIETRWSKKRWNWVWEWKNDKGMRSGSVADCFAGNLLLRPRSCVHRSWHFSKKQSRFRVRRWIECYTVELGVQRTSRHQTKLHRHRFYDSEHHINLENAIWVDFGRYPSPVRRSLAGGARKIGVFWGPK